MMSHPMMQHKTSSKVLELPHMNLMGPMQIEILGGKRYVFVFIDDFYGYTWMNFLKEKPDNFEVFKDSCQNILEENKSVIPISSQQMGIVEQKTRAIHESVRVTLHGKNLSCHFWVEAMNTACYIYNMVTLRGGTSSTLYELWKGRKSTVKYFHVFGSKCHILTDQEQDGKVDPISDEGIFLGYSSRSRTYRIFNSSAGMTMESINVVIDD